MTKAELYAMWAGWSELNAIRARDGAPAGVCEEYFSTVVDNMAKCLGDKYAKPWSPATTDRGMKRQQSGRETLTKRPPESKQ